MAERPSIPVIYGRIISAAVAASGVPMREVVAGTGLGDRDPNTLSGMTITQYRQLLANALRLTNDPMIALRAGLNLPFTVHGAQGVAAAASATLHQAIETLVNFSRLRVPFARVLLRESDEELSLEFVLDDVMGEQARPALEFLMAIVASFIHNLVWAPLTYCKIGFAYPPPRDPDAYRRLLPGEVRFNAIANSIALLQSEAAQALPGSNPEEYRVAIERSRASYQQLRQTDDIADTMLQVFSGHSGHICTVREVADELHLSSRTLQRRLRARGVGFQQLLDQWLSQQALRYLAEDRLTVELTALLLGYSDQANFRRAFRRWFGCAPAEYLR